VGAFATPQSLSRLLALSAPIEGSSSRAWSSLSMLDKTPSLRTRDVSSLLFSTRSTREREISSSSSPGRSTSSFGVATA
jgi:hypothetical protein